MDTLQQVLLALSVQIKCTNAGCNNIYYAESKWQLKCPECKNSERDLVKSTVEKLPVPRTSIPGTESTYADFEESDTYSNMSKTEKLRYQKAKWWREHGKSQTDS